MFVNDLRLKTKQLIDTTIGGSSNFTTMTSIKKIIYAIAANEHLKLYHKGVGKLKGMIDLKLVAQSIKMEDQVAA